MMHCKNKKNQLLCQREYDIYEEKFQKRDIPWNCRDWFMRSMQRVFFIWVENVYVDWLRR